MQHVHDSQAGIQTDEVGQGEGSHGDISSILHDAINIFPGTNSGLQTDDGFVDIRHQDAVRQESGSVSGAGGDLAHALDESNGGFHGLGRRLKTSDDLNALLYGDRVHKVGGDDAGGRLEVRLVGRGGSGNLGDGDGGSVGSQNSVLRSNLGQLGENAGLQVGDFGDGLDHEIYIGEVVHAGARGKSGASSVCSIAGDAFLADIFLQKLVYTK